jgi:hypothetical protein
MPRYPVHLSVGAVLMAGVALGGLDGAVTETAADGFHGRR